MGLGTKYVLRKRGLSETHIKRRQRNRGTDRESKGQKARDQGAVMKVVKRDVGSGAQRGGWTGRLRDEAGGQTDGGLRHKNRGTEKQMRNKNGGGVSD